MSNNIKEAVWPVSVLGADWIIKYRKNLDTPNIAVIILKFEQHGFSIE